MDYRNRGPIVPDFHRSRRMAALELIGVVTKPVPARAGLPIRRGLGPTTSLGGGDEYNCHAQRESRIVPQGVFGICLRNRYDLRLAAGQSRGHFPVNSAVHVNQRLRILGVGRKKTMLLVQQGSRYCRGPNGWQVTSLSFSSTIYRL